MEKIELSFEIYINSVNAGWHHWTNLYKGHTEQCVLAS